MKVLIWGQTGQDGSYMADYLLEKTDCEIVGVERRVSTKNHKNISHLLNNPRFRLISGDLTDAHSVNEIIRQEQPSFCLNFAAQSFVFESWNTPAATFQINTIGVINLLEAIRKYNATTRLYSAGCHDIHTRVLTTRGLQYYTELKKEDLVYSINPNNGNLELKPIVNIFEYDYKGKLYEFKRGGMRITPNHKVLYQKNDGRILTTQAKDFIKLSNARYPINNPYSGILLPEFYDLSSHIPIKGKETNKTYGQHISKINSYDLCYLIGLYIGDGSCRILKKQLPFSGRGSVRDKISGRFVGDKEKKQLKTYYCPQIIIDIPVEDAAHIKLINVLKQNKIKYGIYNKMDVTFCQWGLIPILKECGLSASTKTIPDWIFTLDSSYQKKVLEGIIDSDGDNRGAISTVSSALKESLLKLFLHCGIIPSFWSRPARTAILKDGRAIKGNYPENTIYGLKERTGYQRGNYTEIEYDGKVWCLEIADNHNFVVERHGRMTFSGNSSEEWGNVDYSPQDINHPLKPRSPYGGSKAAAGLMVKVYRESYNLFAIHGKLLNHESPRRSEEFVTRKITKGVARIANAIKHGETFEPISLGNINAQRDLSHALDFCDGIWKMMNQKTPKEYVLSSNETHTIREFVEKAFAYAGINGFWMNHSNTPESEVYLTNEDYGRPLVKIDPKFYRPAEVALLCGNSNPAREELGWRPKISFDELIRLMVENDVNELAHSTR